jgi:hypothetical protein
MVAASFPFLALYATVCLGSGQLGGLVVSRDEISITAGTESWTI